MAYADLNTLIGRAGRLAGAWDDDTTPNLSDLQGFLDTSSDELDAALSALGVAPVPVVDVVATKAMAGMVADMALLLSIDATWPGGRGGDDVAAAREAVEKRLGTGVGSFADEKARPAFVAYLLGLIAGGDVTPDAADFWSTEYDYGRTGSASVVEAASVSPYVLPGFAKGMRG